MISTQGHQKIEELMLKSLQDDQQSGTFLFVGPEGIGKKKLALELAQFFLCQSKTGCGSCGSCKRVKELTHESLLYIEPQNQLIKIEEADRIKEFLRFQGLTAKRFILINEAHQMNLSFANAILKTLEEPAQGVFFILISHQPKSILPTIKSRSRLIRFHSLSAGVVKKITQEWGYHSDNLIYRGQLHLIKEFIEDDKQNRFLQTLGFLQNLLFSKDILLQTEWRYHYKDKSHFLDFLSLAPLILRDALVLHWDKQSENLIFPQEKQEIEKLNQVSYEKIFQLSDFIKKVSRELKWSPDPVLLFENIICELNS